MFVRNRLTICQHKNLQVDLTYILRSRSKLGIVLHTAACFYD